ncbi:hypothetical protein DPMN_181605, partial [Dreissena polymorpha]
KELKFYQKFDNIGVAESITDMVIGWRLHCWNRILKAIANSLDPDETPPNMACIDINEEKCHEQKP